MRTGCARSAWVIERSGPLYPLGKEGSCFANCVTSALAREPLARAAGSFAEEADALDASAPFIGWEAPQEVDPDWYAQAAALVTRARDDYVRGIDAVEAAASRLQ